MSTYAFILVTIGAAFTGLYEVFTKRIQQGDWKNRTCLLVAFLQGGAGIMLLLTSIFTGGAQVRPGFLAPLIITGLINVLIMFGMTKARSLEDVSLINPITSITTVFIILTGMLILDERAAPLGWAGIFLITIGAYVLNIQDLKKRLIEKEAPKNWRQKVKIWLAPFIALGHSSGVRWALFASIFGTISVNYDGLVARRANIGFGFGLVFLIAALGNLAVAYWRNEHRGVRLGEAIKVTFPLAFFFAASNFITNFAYRAGIVPYVATLKKLSIPFTIILAYLIIKERKSFRDRLIGGIIMTIGAALIVLSRR